MNYLSVCSGIEAATVAWEPLGWRASAYSEIEKFPSAVLTHHYGSNMPGEPLAQNGTPNLGDMSKYKEWPDYADIDVLVGGTPCQAFSVAGLRKGLADPRGNLALVYLGIADRYRPNWVVWENVPGVLSSNDGRDFGAFLGGLGQLGYGWAYRVLDAQYIRVESHARAVPQRRRRVFVVGYLGDWRRAAAVLFERESMSGHPTPRRRTETGIARGFEVGPGSCGFTDISPTLDARCKDGPIRNQLGVGVAMAIHPHCIGRGPDAGPQGKEYLDDGSAYTMDSRGVSQAVAFDWYASQSQHMPVTGECPPLKTTMQPAIQDGIVVRRLTPRECERLQGFSDDYTNFKYGRPKHDGQACPDGPRYKALGNSMAVPVMRWIGERINQVDAIKGVA